MTKMKNRGEAIQNALILFRVVKFFVLTKIDGDGESLLVMASFYKQIRRRFLPPEHYT